MVKEFNEISGTPEKFDPKKVALYTALVLEEVAEMLDSFGSEKLSEIANNIEEYSQKFKSQEFTDLVESENFDKVAFLDAAVDIAVVSVGAGIAVGADIDGATRHVGENNLSKFPIIDGVRTVLKDPVSGKVMKPQGYQSPNLEPFLK